VKRTPRIIGFLGALFLSAPFFLNARAPLAVEVDSAPKSIQLPFPSEAAPVLSLLPGAAEVELAVSSEEEARPLFSLQDNILALIMSAGLGYSEWGVLAVSLDQGDTLVAMGAHIPLAPASNQKLFTTAAALDLLGAAYRFPTYLLMQGEVQHGVLDGDLILLGTGDPSISGRLLGSATRPFEEFAAALSAAGIHTVTGEVLGDGSYFEGPTRRDAWNPADLNDWFAAPVSALTFNENMVTLRIVPGAPGERPRVLTIPEGAALPIVNNATTISGAPRTPITISRYDPDGEIEIRGEIRATGAEVWREMTVSDPPSYAASVLRSVLQARGIQIIGGSRSVSPGEGYVTGSGRTIAPAFRQEAPERTRVVAVHYSPPLRDLLAVVNKRSHNLYAELLLFALGKFRSGDGSFAGGGRALTDFLVGSVGISEEELVIDDGSGLSRLNRATPAAFVSLLSFVARAPYADTFWATLPEAGSRQELNRMHQSAAAGNLRAKTGTINRVSALSGVVHTSEGEAILFSILSNQVPTSSAKRVEDRIGIQLASTTRPPANSGSLAGPADATP